LPGVTAAGAGPGRQPGDDQCQGQCRGPRPPDAERYAPPGARRQCPQDGCHFARRAAGAGCLDREHVLQICDQLGIVGVAVLLTLGRCTLNDGSERGRHLWPLALDVGEDLADVLHRYRDLVLALEWHLSGQHLVQHDAQRIQVRLSGDRLAERLLG
jgi:hypothetical protein